MSFKQRLTNHQRGPDALPALEFINYSAPSTSIPPPQSKPMPQSLRDKLPPGLTLERMVPLPTSNYGQTLKKARMKRASSAGYVSRPPNAWSLFHHDFTQQNMAPANIRGDDIMVLASIVWQSLGPEGQRPWYLSACDEKAAHQRAHPDYSYSDYKRQRGSLPKKSRSRTTRGAKRSGNRAPVQLVSETDGSVSPMDKSNGDPSIQGATLQHSPEQILHEDATDVLIYLPGGMFNTKQVHALPEIPFEAVSSDAPSSKIDSISNVLCKTRAPQYQYSSPFLALPDASNVLSALSDAPAGSHSVGKTSPSAPEDLFDFLYDKWVNVVDDRASISQTDVIERQAECSPRSHDVKATMRADRTDDRNIPSDDLGAGLKLDETRPFLNGPSLGASVAASSFGSNANWLGENWLGENWLGTGWLGAEPEGLELDPEWLGGETGWLGVELGWLGAETGWLGVEPEWPSE